MLTSITDFIHPLRGRTVASVSSDFKLYGLQEAGIRSDVLNLLSEFFLFRHGGTLRNTRYQQNDMIA